MVQKKSNPTITKNTSEKHILEIGKQCKKCGACCSRGSGFVLQEEIKKIAKYLGISDEQFKKDYLEEVEFFNTKQYRVKMNREKNRPHGKCVLLTEKNFCSIQKVKPLHCRISTCADQGPDVQTWFMITFFLNPNDPESVRQYSSYLKSNGKLLQGAKLGELVPDKKTLKSILSYEKLR